MTFITQGGLKKHSKKHDPNRVFPYKCPVCTRGFLQCQEMRQHVLRVHTDQESSEVIQFRAAIKAAATQAREAKKKEAWRKRQISMHQTRVRSAQYKDEVGQSTQLSFAIPDHFARSW
jgi:hypothetical protein